MDYTVFFLNEKNKANEPISLKWLKLKKKSYRENIKHEFPLSGNASILKNDNEPH